MTKEENRNIKLENITKKYDSDFIMHKLNLTIPQGKFFALLGPSGCGKTTLLRLIGGFEKVDAGRIFLGDEEITDLPINQRRVNTVFQNYALFPHLNVFQNVAYSLSIRNVARDIIKDKVHNILKSVHLEPQANKDINQLSGGQKQRVAIARAIINEPDVLLLDEPLAALDLKLREHMLLELIELQEKIKTTFVYVTHDQTEALTVADQMAIMNYNGEIEQIGTPKEIYEFPGSTFVAKFVGSTNLFSGKLKTEAQEDFIDIPDLGQFKVYVPVIKRNLFQLKSVFVSIRPEKFYITTKETPGFSNKLEGTIKTIAYHGRSTQYNVKLKNDMIIQVLLKMKNIFLKK